ncbi:bifunctional 4-hydroxy-2-oxoglutarate aldolase/2-dehydro-3-deoxy-phosphogluconate aldolase [Arthrobacter sp. MA-N2]|uniref:bifunctional 4-hydroxy-2-oxoglutarate aldolase/2-dehydro-3-deoxy-phosphogluconate aldolase n=1 Tax=Arthrobacter sp. MA-N2 TaxID=1101188 RepID=UPI000552098D|nr:bifunctional 4-hydroxy-2-oxoglutarate aldolase/2-dehydro-3-deoxy-phosphogluconate aldolase [Arthrobacter sp. MA-N2]
MIIETRTQRPAPSGLLLKTPVIAVLRASHAREYLPVIDALVRGGISTIELTLSTEGVFDALPLLVREFGSEAEIGVGTITSGNQANRALAGGAAFLVTPTMNIEVLKSCAARGIPVYPGGLTPTELLEGWNAGATAVKVFPASTVGPGYLAQLRGPFPDIQVIPSGGVGTADAIAWIEAGAMAVSIGSPLLQDVFDSADLAGLAKRADDLTARVAESLAARNGKMMTGGQR